MIKKLILLLSFLTIFFSSPKSSFCFDNEIPTFQDNFTSINSSTWAVNDVGNHISFSNGINLISDSGKFFPFISSKINIFPSDGNFYVKVKFQYLESTDFGVGFGFGNITPVYGLTTFPFLDSDFVKFQVWQSNNEKFNIDTRQCDSPSICSSTRTNVYNAATTLGEHTIKIKNINGVTSVYIDDTLTPLSPYTNTNWRPTVFWMGNLSQLKTSNNWSDIKIVSVETGRIEQVEEITKTIIIPGLGASWNFNAILNGSDDMNWQIPNFINIYDGLVQSFENVDYVENTNLFVFPYDWRRPLNVLAGRLNTYIEEKIPSGEKVNIVGHSMGGLVARAYVKEHGSSRINMIVTVGSPNMGSVKAYGVWEGATIWDDAWWAKLALDLTTHFGAQTNEKMVDTVQRLVPSMKDLLPTYNFLVWNDNIATPLPLNTNTYLNSLNNAASGTDNIVSAIYSNEIQTDSLLKVTTQSEDDVANNRWVNGKPTESPFVASSGDGTVIEASAKGPFLNFIQGTGWHGELVTKTDNIQKIFNVLDLDTDIILPGVDDSRKNVFVAALRSPGTLEVCNSEITLCDDDLGLYFPDNKLFILPNYDNENLVVRVKEKGMGDYELHLGNINDKSNWKIIGGNLGTPGQLDFYNVSSDGNVVTPVIDKTGPSTPSIAGFNNPEAQCGASINANSVVLDWSESSDTNGVAGYEYEVDYPLPDGTRSTLKSAGLLTITEEQLSVNEGLTNIKVRAIDKIGNYSEWSNMCGITADRKAPVVKITSPITGTYQPDKLPKLSYTATDNLDSNLTVEDTKLLTTEGTHTVTVTATDDAGNAGLDSVSYTIKKQTINTSQCNRNGWRLFWFLRFRNQNDCVNYFEKLERMRLIIHKQLNLWGWYW